MLIVIVFHFVYSFEIDFVQIQVFQLIPICL